MGVRAYDESKIALAAGALGAAAVALTGALGGLSSWAALAWGVAAPMVLAGSIAHWLPAPARRLRGLLAAHAAAAVPPPLCALAGGLVSWSRLPCLELEAWKAGSTCCFWPVRFSGPCALLAAASSAAGAAVGRQCNAAKSAPLTKASASCFWNT